jgi:hypothetical protein
MKPSDVSAAALNSISVIERLSSVLSLFGATFIAITFCFSTAFRKPINRLVFYASLGNMVTCIATLIARSAIPYLTSFLCQFQAFLLQTYVVDAPLTRIANLS